MFVVTILADTAPASRIVSIILPSPRGAIEWVSRKSRSCQCKTTAVISFVGDLGCNATAAITFLEVPRVLNHWGDNVLELSWGAQPQRL